MIIWGVSVINIFVRNPLQNQTHINYSIMEHLSEKQQQQFSV